jgi:hypothetical protein
MKPPGTLAKCDISSHSGTSCDRKSVNRTFPVEPNPRLRYPLSPFCSLPTEPVRNFLVVYILPATPWRSGFCGQFPAKLVTAKDRGGGGYTTQFEMAICNGQLR